MTAPASSNGTHPPCGWVDWCDRQAAYELELSNRAGSERIAVCRLHLAAARIYGYRPTEGVDGSP